jgi:hypothetical protein
VEQHSPTDLTGHQKQTGRKQRGLRSSAPEPSHCLWALLGRGQTATQEGAAAIQFTAYGAAIKQ